MCSFAHPLHSLGVDPFPRDDTAVAEQSTTTVPAQPPLPTSLFCGTSPRSSFEISRTRHLRTLCLTAFFMAAGGSSRKSHSRPMSSITFLADCQVQPRRCAVTRTAATGPVAVYNLSERNLLRPLFCSRPCCNRRAISLADPWRCRGPATRYAKRLRQLLR